MQGFSVFSEKPAALNLAELLALKDVVTRSNRLYGLAHTYLGYPMVWQAREMVRDGVIGAVRKVDCRVPPRLAEPGRGRAGQQAGCLA